jgi:tetratricopeptide (TPR) repeat protein/tRNA A-37 threonylcarbamoyl transferase component Bud32
VSDSRDRAQASASTSWSGDRTLPEEASDGFEPPAGTVVGRYTVLSTVGRGAAGVVVAAFDPQLDRKVALKFLHRRLATDADHERLRSEAQALARLTHTNVIRVHDVGTFEGRVFMATEYVDGRDLASWRAERRPGWREVIDVMLAAGEGLAAAHAAGLVHRDFKPRNVLLGSDGRPRVTDFGLARGYEDQPSAVARSAHDHDDDAAHDIDPEASLERSFDGLLTRTGVLAGTPAYMAPEQLEGAPADPRADQWSFCVSLHELLWGQRPFEGGDLRGLAAAIRAGRLTPPPAFPRVPAGVRRVLRQGLSNDPARRFPSIDALLVALRRAAHWRRRAGWLALPAALSLTATAAIAWPSPPPHAVDYCEEHDRRLDALWGPAQHDAIERAFVDTGLPYAPTAWARVRDHVDGFAEAWRTAERDACEAEARGEPVGERMLCLHRRFQGLRSLVELLSQADAAVVEHAVEAAQALETIESCESDGRPAPPADPETREQLEALDDVLARARVAGRAGRRDESLALAKEAVRMADSLRLRWPQAEARFAEAIAADDDGDGKAALVAFEAAFSAGIAAGHDDVVARSALGMAGLVARVGDFEAADRWLELAAAAIDRHGDRDGELASALESTRGRTDFHRGDFESALAHFRRTLELDQAAGRGDGPSQGSTHLNVGLALSSLGRNEDALVSLDDALAREQHHYGQAHPRAVRVLNSLCHVRSYAGRIDAAIEACEEGIALTRTAGSTDDPKLVHLYTNYGAVLFRAGRYGDTETAYLEALALAERIYGESDPMVGNVLNNLGVLYVDTGELAKAQANYGRALVLFDAAFGTEHPTTGILRTNLAMAYSNDGKLDEAERLLRQSIEVLGKTLGEDHVDLALSLAELGRLQSRRDRPREALPLFERAQALREAAGGEPIELADTKYGLALAAWEVGQKPRAHALLGQARRLYEEAGGERLVRLEEIDAWLAAHPV